MNLRELGERTSSGERKKAGGGKGRERERVAGRESERENRAGESARRGPAEPE